MNIGEIIQQRYLIQKQLGLRDSQQTFLALDQHTQKLVVVKLLFFNQHLNWETFKLFEREAKTLQALSHPAIPQYLDYFEIDDNNGKGFALVQSYLKAPSLENQVNEGRTFTEEELKQFAIAILHILDYLHTQQPPIIHRDLKPSNILLSNRSGHQAGQVYLVDFGSVQAAANQGSTLTIVGTYGYMPPEQFGGRAVQASDLYSLGATLIYLASGLHPADLPQKDLRLDFESSVNLSPQFTRWLRKMIQPSLEKRFSSAKEAINALLKPVGIVETQFLIPTKPFNSQVHLSKQDDVLDIFIPPKGFHVGLIPIIIFAVIWNGFLILWYSIAFATWNNFGWFAAFFATGHLCVGLGLILTIIFTLFGHTRLRIDSEQITLKNRLFGINSPFSKPKPRQRITRIERTPITYRQDSDGDRVTVHPQIKIWVGTKHLSLGNDGRLSEPELDWLAYELSDWLDLPIS
ncbi:serine/threonine protein kinase [Aphanothece hegewaldii CCALA 016]|uniref:Serine/threonine protein kinase n=1 Tax=Aphanothece hegewaldii CCALA 016 TaxID=2107694 RepID=A0A2T1LRY8_9CHRO|nr:serine/threonine-protein kinase [Aphanothece hegewaldii]PSF32093.1 serine/threonine protein kinase [Aphanothece hegewaldii CCALA 016]